MTSKSEPTIEIEPENVFIIMASYRFSKLGTHEFF